MDKVLIVDDDQRLLKMLMRTMMYEGFDVCVAGDGHAALQQVYSEQPDVIVLDWMMPKLDGVDVLIALREDKNTTPILMLTARDAVQDRVQGLDRGADDYLVKPFATDELIARIRALLRRVGKGKTEKVEYADLSLDPTSRQAYRGSRNFTLTPTEYDLLLLFLRHPRQVLERRQILTSVWGYDFVGDDNIIEVYIGYLRKKMEALGEIRLIQTVRGVGYVLREND